MQDNTIRELAVKFRNAIEKACDKGLFANDTFNRFPRGCCGDTSYLLAEYFCENGIESIYVNGTDAYGQGHAWLVIKDMRIRTPVPEYFEMPEYIKIVLNRYGNEKWNDSPNTVYYSSSDLENGLIVDLTADQFGEAPVYVDCINDFYRKFEFRSADDYICLGNERMSSLYQTILSCLE
ncbi:MAG: hypothetical protein LUG45_07235 [Clostridiales bacterium]|nr:hypothetical protein [Clostridiales bacterium]